MDAGEDVIPGGPALLPPPPPLPPPHHARRRLHLPRRAKDRSKWFDVQFADYVQTYRLEEGVEVAEFDRTAMAMEDYLRTIHIVARNHCIWAACHMVVAIVCIFGVWEGQPLTNSVSLLEMIACYIHVGILVANICIVGAILQHNITPLGKLFCFDLPISLAETLSRPREGEASQEAFLSRIRTRMQRGISLATLLCAIHWSLTLLLILGVIFVSAAKLHD